MQDVGASHIPLVALNKTTYEDLAEQFEQGIVFATYSSLVAQEKKDVDKKKKKKASKSKEIAIFIEVCRWLIDSHSAALLAPDFGHFGHYT